LSNSAKTLVITGAKSTIRIIIVYIRVLITKALFKIVFNSVPVWLNYEINNTFVDLFLVCQTDLPCIDVREIENGAENRNLFQ
jgi:hypothetical protein